MTGLLHQHFRSADFAGSDAEALSYLKDSGWTSRMATPSPAIHLAGSATFVGLGVWAAIALGRHEALAGIAVGLLAAALAVVDLLPALWTLTHRQYTGQYLAAKVRYGNGQPRLHPALTLVSPPVLAFLAAASTASHGSGPVRAAWGLLAAAVALALGLLRVAHARHSGQISG